MRLALVLLASLGQHGVAQDATLVSADHPRADVRLLDGSGCERHLLIGRESRLSGHGKLWEVRCGVRVARLAPKRGEADAPCAFARAPCVTATTRASITTS